MTTGETEDTKTCGQQEKAGRLMGGGGGGGGGSTRLSRSFTTLSTIAIQAGQSQIVVSVLRSGSLVHLQLVQVHPGLCEIGSNREENQTLIQEQQQLMEKLQKHEEEVLALVENSRRSEQARKRRDETNPEEEEVHKAMTASLSEGWSLLLRLMQRRQEVLMLASEFFRRVLEFSVGIDRVEDLQIRPDEDRLTEVQLTYESMRRDLLRKSMEVLTSSSVLLQNLRQLQRTEALQRRGGVLQDEEGEESSHCSRGVALRLEELVEALQDRRRRADQAVSLQLHQAQKDIVVRRQEQESRPASTENWTHILVQNLQSESTPAENTELQSETRDLQPGPRGHVRPGSRSEETRDVEAGFSSEETRNPKSSFRSDLKSELRLEENKELQPESRSDIQSGSGTDLLPGLRHELKIGSRLEDIRNLQSRFKISLKSDSESETQDLQSGSNSFPMPKSRSEETRNLQPRAMLHPMSVSISEQTRDVEPGFTSEETRNLASGSRSDVKPESRSDLKTRSEENEDLQSESSSEENEDLQSESSSEETIELHLGSRTDMTCESRSDLNPGSSSEKTRGLQPGSRSDLQSDSTSDETRNSESKLISDVKTESRSGDTIDLHPGSRSETKELLLHVRPRSRSEKATDLQSKLTLAESKVLQPRSRSEDTTDLQSCAISLLKLGSRSKDSGNLKPEAKSEETGNLKPQSKSEETGNLQPESTSEETIDLQSHDISVLKPGSRSEEAKKLQFGSRSNVQLGFRSILKPGSVSQAEDVSRKQEEAEQHRPAVATSGQESQSGGDHAHQVLLTNQRQQLLSSCEHLMDKVWSWVQQGSSVLSNSSEAGRQLSEAEDTLNTHLQLLTQAESAGHDAENLKRILDEILALQADTTSSASPQPLSEPSRQLSPLKALTEQLKRGGTGGQTRTSPAHPGPTATNSTGSQSPELAGRVDLILKELHGLNKKIDSNLQLLKPYVTFLRTAQQVEEEMEELREIYSRTTEEEEQEEQEEREVLSPLRKKEQVEACWQEALQRLLTAQELGNSYVHTIAMVLGSGLNLQSVVSVVQQTVEQLNRTKQEVNELRSHQQIQIQQQQQDLKYCRKYQERLSKTVQDLNCVSELLDSCTLLDLGTDLQTSRLLERFSQARPHFNKLDAEVEYVLKSWETLREVQDRLEVKEVKEENLSELLKLQKRVKDKIQQSESILDLTSSFHLTAKQLEELLCSDPGGSPPSSTGQRGSAEAELSRHTENQQQIQSLLKTASRLKADICTAVTHSGWTGFKLDQLEDRLLSLDSLCVSWLIEAAQREEKLRRELLTRLLNQDINQLRDSFKELKKKFSNLKFNYMKRNDRTRNMKAVRNQLQQVELYEEKLQVLRTRLQGVTARLGSEVKDGGVAREVEDAINELQRQMGEFERSVGEHKKTLDMTCRLQHAMEEYQFWCEEASATIARVGKFSSECRSTEAVSVLYRQFEKFVWPTVPQQEERISQITELAVRLHGAEEGRRYIEKTVGKHSEMVESIRELSDGLMELEAKLKLESLKQQQNDGEKQIKEEGEMEQRRGNGTEEKDEEKEKEVKDINIKMKKKKQVDNRSTQEAADMYELKETGHTPELTPEHDGKEVLVKRQTDRQKSAASRKPPLQKSHSEEADRPTCISESSHRQQEQSERLTSSYCSTHTFSLSCSPLEGNRRVHSIQSLLQPVAAGAQATPPPPVIGPSFSDVQREFQRKEMQALEQQDASASLSEAELQQQEVMTDDSLSNDEYDCASPDDISLPPLAETPESSMIQSDIEEGFCFSSHSIHIHHYSQPYRAQSEHSGTSTATGAVRQHRESRQTEGCATPLSSLHSRTRFRSESNSFVQSPLTVPAPSFLSSIPRTEETSIANFSHSTDLSLSGPEPDVLSGSNPVHESNTTDSYDKEDNVPERSSPSKTEPLLNDHNSHYNQPQRSIGTQGKSTQNFTAKSENLPQTDPIPYPAELDQNPTLPKSSYCPQPDNSAEPELHKHKIPPQTTRILKCSTIFPQIRTVICQDNIFRRSFPDTEIVLDQDINSSQTRKETSTVAEPERDGLSGTSMVTQQTVYFQSSPSASNSLIPPHKNTLFQSKILPPQINPVPQARGFPQSPKLADSNVHKVLSQDILKSFGTCLQTSTTLPQDSNLSHSYPDSRSGLNQSVPSSQNSKETSSVNMAQSSSLTTTTAVTQQMVYCQSTPSDMNVSPAGTTFKSKLECSSPHSNDVPDVHAPILPKPNNISNINISSSTIRSSNRLCSKQSHQTIYSLHDTLISTCTQQCVHDPGMTPSSPAKPTAPPQPEAQTQALAQQANPHVTPPSSPPHLLTSDQDPDICQPMAIREEIRLTPQIQGPPLPAPPLPQAQAETLPQGKASKTVPPCFTRPLSRATVMEGSPVTLEVEVTEHPEPMLTRFKDGDESATSPGRALVCEDGKHFLFVPETSDSDVGLCEARAANHHDSQHRADNSSSDNCDRWLVAEVFDIVSVDWQTWYGTLCVVLWLLYLILL